MKAARARSALGHPRSAFLLVLGSLSWGCGGEDLRTPALARLGPALGRPSFVQLGREVSKKRPGQRRRPLRLETRSALVLSPGDAPSCVVPVAPGSRLDVAFAVIPGGAPEHGVLRLQVEAQGRVVLTRRQALVRDDRWHRASVTLPDGGDAVRLTLRADHVDAEDRPFPAEASAAPWIALASPRLAGPTSGPAGRRVFVWISQDTVRADHLTAWGYARGTTPRFQRSAEEGWTLFDHAVAPASWTLPSLASQFTSRYPSFHGAVTEAQARDRTLPTLFQVLGDQGFTVLGVTGNLFVSDDFGTAEGFDALWYTAGRSDEVTRLALGALDEWPGGDLALFVHYQDPHHPYEPPEPFDRLFAAAQPRVPDSRDPAQLDYTVAQYDGEIAFTDEAIQVLLRELAARKLLDSGVLAYTADHGEEFQEHGAWAHARTVYEELVHVPLAVRVPGLRARRVPQVVSLVDLAPTVLAAYGLAAPPSFQGRSLLPLLEGRALPDAPAYSETQRNLDREHLVAVREGDFKYVLATHPGLAGTPEVLREELYDLAADPGERTLLRRPTEVERLRRRAIAYLTSAAAEVRRTTPSRITPDNERRLRALGYIE